MRRSLIAVATLLLGATLVAGPADAGEDSSMTGAPSVGDCYDLTWDDVGAYSVEKDPVYCGDGHTTKVVAVQTLPGNLDWHSSDESIGKVVSKTCGSAFDKAVGGTAASQFKTQYTWYWFAPSRSQRDAGARWFSCHVGVQEDSALGDIAEPLERIDRHVSDAIARCIVGEAYYWTTCADRHDWRMNWARKLHGGTSKQQLLTAAQHYCPRHVSTRRWLYSWDILDKHNYILGCSSRTRR